MVTRCCRPTRGWGQTDDGARAARWSAADRHRPRLAGLVNLGRGARVRRLPWTLGGSLTDGGRPVLQKLGVRQSDVAPEVLFRVDVRTHIGAG